MTNHTSLTAASLGVLLVILAIMGCGDVGEGTHTPGIDLPRVGTLGRAPSGEGVIHVVIDGDGRISLDGVGPLDLGTLRVELRMRTADGQWRDICGRSRKVLLHADASVPWMVVQWVLQVGGEPPTGLYRVYFGARPWEGPGRGAIGITCPTDTCGPSPLPEERVQRLAVRLFGRDEQEVDADPELLFDEIRAGRISQSDVRTVFDIYTPRPLGRAVPAGFVLRVLDVALRAGVTDVVFEGAPGPLPEDEHDVDALLAHVAEVKARGAKVKMRFGSDRIFTGRPGRALRPPGSARGLLPHLYGQAPDAVDPVSSETRVFETAYAGQGVLHEEPLSRVRGADAAEARALAEVEFGDPVEPRDALPRDEALRDDALSDTSFEGPSSSPSTSRWRDPFRASWPRWRQQRRPSSATRRSVDAVEHALCWLAAHQSPDGSWGAATFMRWCDGAPVDQAPDGPGNALYDPGVTGLALCAFRGAGYTSRGRHPYAKTIWRGLRYLKSVQDGDGCFGSRSGRSWIYNHAVGALAMVEAYGATGSPIFKASAQKALDLIALARSPDSGWRYGVRPGDCDTSVTGWMVAVLHSANLINRVATERGGPPPLRIDEEAFVGARAWIEKMTDPDYGRTGYRVRGGSPARYREQIDRHPDELSESMTASAIFARIAMGENARVSEIIKKGARLCATLSPTWDPAAGSIDMTYWYWGSLALYQVGGGPWKKWNTALIDALCGSQRLEGTYCGLKGSWDPLGPWGTEGGRVYATAMLAMCLETPYRYD